MRPTRSGETRGRRRPRRRGPRRLSPCCPGGPAMRVAASALSGMTLTTSAAASGSMPQPLTRSSTVRKSAAAMAPETSARATNGTARAATGSAATSPRPFGRAGREGAGSARHPGIAASAAGACSRKTERHPKACVRAPPIAGPAAVPSRAASRQSRRPPLSRSPSRQSAPAVVAPSPTSAACAVTSSAAPPSAWIERAIRSSSMLPASPQISDPSANKATPVRPTSRSRADSRRGAPAGAGPTASTTAYTPRTAATPATSVSSSRRIGGRASATIAVSASARNATPASGRRAAAGNGRRAAGAGMCELWLSAVRGGTGSRTTIGRTAPYCEGVAIGNLLGHIARPARLTRERRTRTLRSLDRRRWTAEQEPAENVADGCPPQPSAGHPGRRPRSALRPGTAAPDSPRGATFPPQWICDGCAWGSGSRGLPGCSCSSRSSCPGTSWGRASSPGPPTCSTRTPPPGTPSRSSTSCSRSARSPPSRSSS